MQQDSEPRVEIDEHAGGWVSVTVSFSSVIGRDRTPYGAQEALSGAMWNWYDAAVKACLPGKDFLRMQDAWRAAQVVA